MLCSRGLLVDPAPRRLFDIAYLTEQPDNKLWLHTACHGVLVTEIVSWYNVRTLSRVYMSRYCTRNFMVLNYEELLLSSGALTHMLTPPPPPHSSGSFRADIMKTSRTIFFTLRVAVPSSQPIIGVAVWRVFIHRMSALFEHVNNCSSKQPDNAE